MADDVKHDKAALAENKDESSFVLDADFEGAVLDIIPTSDDPTMPSLTFRVWLIGTVFMVLFAAVNNIFNYRGNPFGLSSYIATLLSYPIGKAMARYLPSVKFFGIDTNPGPFTIKEHMLIGVFASTGASGIYGIDNINIQILYFNTDVGWLASIGFLLTTSVLGFGLAGVFRKYLIRPKHMIWPTVLPGIAMYSAFHRVKTKANEDDGKQHWSQLKMFFVCFVAMFTWEIVPYYVASGLQYIPLLCFFSPANSVAQKLGSPLGGAGVLSISLDWTQAGGVNMVFPFWTAVNSFVSLVVFTWILSPLALYNSWWGEPKQTRFNKTWLYTKYGEHVSPSVLLTDDNHLDPAKYDANKPIYMSPMFALNYWCSFAQFSATISQCVFFYGSDIWARFKNARGDADENDIHCQIMDQNYPEVPDWWYYFSFGFSIVASLLIFTLSRMSMPWWATFLSIGISAVMILPASVIYATAGIALGMNVISEFLVGLLRPGDPIAMAAFKTMSVCVLSQCQGLLSDLKTAHYLKINPRHMFIAQMASQIMSVFVVYFTTVWWLSSDDHKQWIITQGGDGSDPNANRWSGANQNTFFNASLIWGAIGPKRFFFDSVYGAVIWTGFLAGFIGPVLIKLAQMFLGEKYIPWRLVNFAILVSGGSAGYPQSYILTGFLISVVFNFYVFRWHRKFWQRHNYVMSAGFDAGAAILVLINNFTNDANWSPVPAWFLNGGADMGSYGDWCQLDREPRTPDAGAPDGSGNPDASSSF